MSALLRSNADGDEVLRGKLKKITVVLSIVTGGHGNFTPPASSER